MVVEFLVMFCPFWFFAYHYLMELRFYSGNNWDFDANSSKWHPRFSYGPFYTEQSKVKNRERIFYSYPVMLLVTGLTCLAYVFGLHR
jgi:hypothetical protein